MRALIMTETIVMVFIVECYSYINKIGNSTFKAKGFFKYLECDLTNFVSFINLLC